MCMKYWCKVYSKIPFVAQNVGPEIQPLPFLETICIREHILLFLLMWFWNNVIHDGDHRQKMVKLYCVKLSKPWNWSSCTFHDCCIFFDNAATSPLLWTQSASVCWLPGPGDNLTRVWDFRLHTSVAISCGVGPGATGVTVPSNIKSTHIMTPRCRPHWLLWCLNYLSWIVQNYVRWRGKLQD